MPPEENTEITPESVDDLFDNPDEELDLPPEYCRYRDTGCEFAESCLNCPFTKCIYDEPGGKQRYTKRLRDKKMLDLFTAERKRIRELAVIFGISQRTVQRALKRARNERRLHPDTAKST